MCRAQNQFVSYRAEVKKFARKGSNELVITFPSTFKKVQFFSTILTPYVSPF